jgi:hypothetical protein
MERGDLTVGRVSDGTLPDCSGIESQPTGTMKTYPRTQGQSDPYTWREFLRTVPNTESE